MLLFLWKSKFLDDYIYCEYFRIDNNIYIGFQKSEVKVPKVIYGNACKLQPYFSQKLCSKTM